ILAYNLTIALKHLVLKGDWIKKTIFTLRWQIIFIPAKIVYHSREIFVKVKYYFFNLFNSIFAKIQFSLPSPA
ncbi:MAG: hypothetical protein WHV67_03775, partial [Thermoanaerobaculia bacterium]